MQENNDRFRLVKAELDEVINKLENTTNHRDLLTLQLRAKALMRRIVKMGSNYNIIRITFETDTNIFLKNPTMFLTGISIEDAKSIAKYKYPKLKIISISQVQPGKLY